MRVLSKSSRRRASVFFVSSLLLTATGCDDRDDVALRNDGARPLLRIGLVPEQNLFRQKKRYEPLADYLSSSVGARIELALLTRYGDAIEKLASGDLDGAFFGSFAGALAQERFGVEALVRPERVDGTSTYHGLIFARKDSGIAGSADMRGKRFVFVDRATTAGWILPLHYFKEAGIDDYRSWFGETYFAGTHDGAIYDVLEKRADIGAAKSTLFEALASKDSRISEDLSILARSPEVPANGLFVRRDMDASRKDRLKTALLQMDQDEAGREVLEGFGAVRFIPTTALDYVEVSKFAESVGLDLKTYAPEAD